MKPLTRLSLILTAALAVLAASCAPQVSYQSALRRTTPPEGMAGVPGEARFSYWADGDSGAPLTVRIDLSEQTATFHRAGMKVGQSRVATGRAGHATPTGSFTILEKKADKRSNLYGRIYDAAGRVVVSDADSRVHRVPAGGRFVGAPMPYWMRLTGYGIGMHVGAIPQPGRPASHGCVRMPPEMARTLFAKAPVGTRVTIVP